MSIEPLFSVADIEVAATVSFTFDGRPVIAPAGVSVAAALLLSGGIDFRTSIVGAKPRAPYCMMGVCFECLVEIDGVSARQSCLIPVREGMDVRRQEGAATLHAPDLGDAV